ncbi:hypothetical protein BIZ37_04350 [Photobacterium sp. BZF1]|uniref:hypothetical protein n=1 Tax=Photobacterium sp. BZF1 TaxID=1904457 RepID=UPI00165372DD|nr:hypothetical protein [Photobacterium sp. BZF1]MBC7001775.1 hypothetical protein [Photobacterium sp. BZF1]
MANGREEAFFNLIEEASDNAIIVFEDDKKVKTVLDEHMDVIMAFDFGEGFDLDHLAMLDNRYKRSLSPARFLMQLRLYTPSELKGMVRGGKLNRTTLAVDSGFDTPAFRQNCCLGGILKRFEALQVKNGVLGKPVAKAKSAGPKKHDQREKSNQETSRYNKFLQQRVTELEAENEELKLKLSRYEAIDSALINLGRMPR